MVEIFIEPTMVGVSSGGEQYVSQVVSSPFVQSGMGDLYLMQFQWLMKLDMSMEVSPYVPLVDQQYS